MNRVTQITFMELSVADEATLPAVIFIFDGEIRKASNEQLVKIKRNYPGTDKLGFERGRIASANIPAFLTENR